MTEEKKKLIYLAAPYSHDDGDVVFDRLVKTAEAARLLMRKGFLVFAPTIYGHQVIDDHLRGDYESWRPFDQRMIDACDMMVVLMLEGWKDSAGIENERLYAFSKAKPVEYCTLESLDKKHWQL